MSTSPSAAVATTSSPPPPTFSFSDATPESIRAETEAIRARFAGAIEDIVVDKRGGVHGHDHGHGHGRDDAFAALSLALGDASASSARVTLPSMVHGDASVRAASNEAKDILKEMFDAALSDGGLYDSLLANGGDDGGGGGDCGIGDCDGDGDEDEDARFRRNVLRALRRGGCGTTATGSGSGSGPGGSSRTTTMPSAAGAVASVVRDDRRRIEEACTAFCAAINEDDGRLLFTDDDLDGVDDLDRFPIILVDDDEGEGERTTGTTKTEGKRTRRMRSVGLKAPHTLPILKFATNPDTRRRVYEATSRKCADENTPRFLEVLELRHRCANGLGYASHAHYMCETKMAKTPERAEEFLLEMAEAYGPIREREMGALLDMKKRDVLLLDDARSLGNNANDVAADVSLDPWDIAYYTRAYKAERAGVDEAALRRYFPLEHVKGTILAVYEELLGLKFERVMDASVWHDDVECYSVRSSLAEDEGDGEGGGVLGHFYLDIYPRKGKYSHQCVYPLSPSYRKGEGRVLPACVNIGNLTPSSKGAPSLLLFREVETFFHEFGHVCHCVLSKARHSLHSWAWSAVPWPGGVENDFLEVPSMMLENFVWCPEVLRRLSRNVDAADDDGSSSCLPESTIEAIGKSRFLMTGYAESKYLAMALYDLKVHGGPGPYEFGGKEHDAISLYNAMIEKYTGIAQIPDSFAAASWFHPMMGYDAGYYSYIYSETFAADLFSKFTESSGDSNASVINSNLGRRYRYEILSPCATADGEAMLKNFLGRAPSKDAFLRRISK